MTPINLQWFTFPVNVIIMLTLAFAAYLISILPKTRKIYDWLTSNAAIMSALLLLLAGCLVIGLVPQQRSGCVVTLWNRFYHSWYLALCVSYLFTVLIIRIIHFFKQKQWKKTIGSIVIHIGLITVLAGGYYGIPDEQTWRMDLSNIAFNNQTINTRTEQLQLFPYKLIIRKIEEDKYPSGKPRRITATLAIQDDVTMRNIEIQAGHPLRLKPYALHLRQYRNRDNIYLCTLLIVKQPWRWCIYVGMGLLLLGGLLLLRKKHYLTIMVPAAIMAVIFFTLKLLKPEMFHRELVPSLQSIWFVPHVALYMLSFTILFIAFIFCLLWFFKKKEKLLQQSDDLIRAGMALFITAMLIGSIWAEVAWGHFWTWDLKETWALIACCTYFIYLYYRAIPSHKDSIASLWHILAFITLQMCWYGVNYLPAASASMHIYH